MAANVEKPVIVLAHGAWHPPLHYQGFLTAIRGLGFTVVAPLLPTTGVTDGLEQKGLEDSVGAIREVIKPFLQAGRQIVMICHSHGGFVATDSAVGETIEDRRKRGEAGGIKAMVYIAAFAPPASGLSLFQMVAVKNESDHPDWWFPKDGRAFLTEKAIETLYGDLGEETALLHYSGTVPQSLRSFSLPGKHAVAEILAPKTYIACRVDKTIPYESQVQMATAAGAEIINLDCGHTPFALKEETAQLVDIVTQVAGQN